MAFLGRSDASRILNDVLKRVERMERRQKSGGSAVTPTGIIGSGIWTQLLSSSLSASTPVGVGTPTQFQTYDSWSVHEGTDALTDLSDSGGFVTLPHAGFYSISGYLDFTPGDTHGALLTLETFLDLGNIVVSNSRGGVYLSGGIGATPLISTAVAYVGPIKSGFYCRAFADSDGAGSANLVIVKLT